jgi:hypothetical protein
MAEGDVLGSRALLVESLELAREVGAKESISGTLVNLALLELEGDEDQIDVDRVLASLHESLELARDLGSPVLLCNCLEALAAAERLANNLNLAVRFLGAAARLWASVGAMRTPESLPLYERTSSALRDALGAAEFDRAWQEGAAAPLEEIIRAALESSGRLPT